MISIVMTYFNRRTQLNMTLKSIALYASDIEVVVVDDASNERVDDLVSQFSYPIKLIRIEPQDKWWANPCVPFNIGFKHAVGDKVIIQNAECVHAGNIINHVESNLDSSNYLAYGCYAVAQPTYMRMSQTQDVQRAIRQIVPRNIKRQGKIDGWYNHSIFRPVAYHFTSAIMKSNLDRLGGFDERYANGPGYDDNDFIWRVKRMLQVSIVDSPFSIHLWHGGGSATINARGFANNRAIFNSRRAGSI